MKAKYYAVTTFKEDGETKQQKCFLGEYTTDLVDEIMRNLKFQTYGEHLFSHLQNTLGNVAAIKDENDHITEIQTPQGNIKITLEAE